MDTQTIKNELNAIEQAADRVMAAVKNGNVSDDVRNAASQFHDLARTKREISDEAGLKQAVMEVEQAADRLVASCRNNQQADAGLQQAVEQAHQQASNLKHQVQQQG